MAPDLEVCSLILTDRAARRLRAAGMALEGRAVLAAGYERAVRLAEEGHPWGPQLASLWSFALEIFERRELAPAAR